MRPADRAFPTVVLDTLDPAGPVAAWPARPVIALADDAGTYHDLTCSFQTLNVETGPIDRYGNAPASQLALTLGNLDGRWTRYNAAGELDEWSIGNDIAVWVTNGAWSEWLFRGRLVRFDDLGNGRVLIEALDATDELATPLATDYTPGVSGQTPGQRLTSLLALTYVTNPTRFDVGINQLTAQPSAERPIDEARIIVQSDGGVFFADVDGTLRSYDRRWRGGRTDQPTVPRVSDNVCDELVVWNVEYTTNAEGMADVVKVANVAGLVGSAQRATPPALRNLDTGQTRQQWTTQLDGDQLAAFILRTAPTAGQLGVRGFQIHPFDPLQPGMLSLGAGLRMFDRVTFVHAQPAFGTLPLELEVPTLIAGVTHDITAEAGWQITARCQRAVPYLKSDLWDDTPIKLWDDTPIRYWSY